MLFVYELGNEKSKMLEIRIREGLTLVLDVTDRVAERHASAEFNLSNERSKLIPYFRRSRSILRERGEDSTNRLLDARFEPISRLCKCGDPLPRQARHHKPKPHPGGRVLPLSVSNHLPIDSDKNWIEPVSIISIDLKSSRRVVQAGGYVNGIKATYTVLHALTQIQENYRIARFSGNLATRKD